MKRLINIKYFLAPTIMLLAFAFLLTNKVNAEDSVPTTNTSPSVNKYSLPPVPGNAQEKIKNGIDNRLQNIKNNQETRENMVKNGKLSTTTLPKMLKDDPRFSSTSPRLGERLEKENRASTTKMFLKKDGYENDGRAMAEKMLKERKDNLAKQLDVAIRNLTELRKRIGSRIEKDRLTGKDMTSVSELMKIADAKLVIAGDSVKAVKNYIPSSKDQVASTTSTQTDPSAKLINLDQIRNLVEKSRTAIKDAHKALNDVVVAIAKISGNNLPKNNIGVRPTTLPTPTTNVSTSSTNQ